MRYSKNDQGAHITMMYQLLIDHPRLTSREVCSILDRRGNHFCRSYVLHLMRVAHLQRLREIRFRTEDDTAKIRPSEARWILREMLDEAHAEIHEIERRTRRKMYEYAKRWLL